VDALVAAPSPQGIPSSQSRLFTARPTASDRSPLCSFWCVDPMTMCVMACARYLEDSMSRRAGGRRTSLVRRGRWLLPT